MPKKDINEKGLMPELLLNYLDKHDAVNQTAEALTKKGLAFIAAQNLHRK
jgi:hypothetical protein